MRIALLTLPLLLAATGCRSTPDTPREMYEAVLRDFDADGAGGFRPKVLAREQKRFERIVEWVEEGRLVSAEDHLWSAGALVESDERRHLELAHELALKAAELGDERGFTLQAYAMDKILVDQAAAYQRYGTVIVYQPVLERYELYPVDPSTTDELRRSMGVPGLAELLAEVDTLNEATITRKLRGELVRRFDDTPDPEDAPER